jgi:hypothetical protein
MSVHKKIQPNRSSHLAAVLRNIYMNVLFYYIDWSFSINLRIFATETKNEIVRIVPQIMVSLWIGHATILKGRLTYIDVQSL